MALTRGQVLVELDRRGKLPAEFQAELAALRSKGDQQFLTSLPTDRAALVQAIGEGRTKAPAANSKNLGLLQDVATAFPGFNAADAAAQNAARVDLSKGELGKNIRSLNTAIGHLGSLSANVEALGNTTSHIGLTQFENSIKNRLATGNGGIAPRQFGVDRQAVADELETAFRGGRGGTLAGTKGWEEQLNLNDSPAQQRAAIASAAHLLQSRVDAIGDQYGQAMRTSANGISLLSPESQEAMRRFTSPAYVANGGTLPTNGAPPSSGNESPPNPFNDGNSPASAGDQLSLASGATRQEHDTRAEALINQLARIPGTTAAQINAALSAIGVNATVPEDQLAAAQKAFAAGRPVSVQSLRQVPNSLLARAANTPIGAGLASAADMVLPAGLFGKQAQQNLDALKAAHPDASLAGDVLGLGGAVAAAGGLEAGLGRIAGSIGGFGGRVVGNPLTADALYGGLTGAASTPDDRTTGALTGAGLGAAGGAAGRKLAGMFGGALRGVQNPSVRYLDAQGIPLTAGQTLGGVAKGIEDAAQSLPGVGDMIGRRRLEGFQAFNRAGFDQGLAPISASTNGVTREAGIDLAKAVRSKAYGDALSGVTLTPDAQFGSEFSNAVNAGRQLPDAAAQQTEFALRSAGQQVDPLTGQLTGDGYQQALRRIRRTAAGNASQVNGADIGEVLGQGEDAFRGLLDRQAPAAGPAFDAANTANRNFETLRSAVNAARNGTRTAETGLFAPSQLADAAAANARKFGNTAGTTQQPFFDLTRAGQEVLPAKLGDSGTAKRLLVSGLLGAGTLGGAGGTGYAAGGGEGAGEATAGTLGLGALLAAGGTKVGQRALVRALLDRPAALTRFGDRIVNNPRLGGMFGAALTPPALSYLFGQ